MTYKCLFGTGIKFLVLSNVIHETEQNVSDPHLLVSAELVPNSHAQQRLHYLRDEVTLHAGRCLLIAWKGPPEKQWLNGRTIDQ